eukprot:s9750_g3.t1
MALPHESLHSANQACVGAIGRCAVYVEAEADAGACLVADIQGASGPQAQRAIKRMRNFRGASSVHL